MASLSHKWDAPVGFPFHQQMPSAGPGVARAEAASAWTQVAADELFQWAEDDCLYSALLSLTYILERDTSALPSSCHSAHGTNRRLANGITADGNPHK